MKDKTNLVAVDKVVVHVFDDGTVGRLVQVTEDHLRQDILDEQKLSIFCYEIIWQNISLDFIDTSHNALLHTFVYE